MSARPARVLYVDNSRTFGGAINALAHLVPALDRDRYEPVVLSAQPQAELDRQFPGTPAREWPMHLPWLDGPEQPVARRSRPDPGPLRRLAGKARVLFRLARVELPATVRLAREARRLGADIIHLNNGVEGLLPALLAGKILRVPVVGHSRGPQGTSGAARLYARLVDRWIAVSRTMAENLREAGVDPARVAVVHDAIDVGRFADAVPGPSLRAELQLPEGAPLFGLFGRIIPWKGTLEFVDAAARVLDRLPDARALVVGDPSDGSREYFDRVRRRVEELGLGERVLFTGFRRDVAELMSLCDVVVHTSIVPEPFGMTVIEAMATGTPVVASDSGGPTEIIRPGDTGLLADPRDAGALSDAIAGLLEAPERARAMGERAAARAREEYAAERCARDVQAVYDRVLSSA